MKQAVVIIHGMGEQLPMETLQGFVDAVWVYDKDLISRGREDSSTGEKRKRNPVWGKPDSRNRSYELRRIATESMDGRGPTDFYEFYWAHLIHGTTWEQVKSWIFDLLWRSPRRVPMAVRKAWILLWVVSVIAAIGSLAALLPSATIYNCLFNECASDTVGKQQSLWTIVSPVLIGLASLGLGAFVNVFLIKYFGDVARYVKADPLNVARRQEIREKGVELLETLMGKDTSGRFGPRRYDRIVVVAHSLGTIVAYDILLHCFARLNTVSAVDPKDAAANQQPVRAALERRVRTKMQLAAGKTETVPDDPQGRFELFGIEQFQELQGLCRQELNRQGNPWIVSDFITLGSPLTHAEFLLAKDRGDLRDKQVQRIFATCPPAMEFDGTTRAWHFTYGPSDAPRDETGGDFRHPHHAALFAYTRWTNLYSPHKMIFWGDVISGPLSEQFGFHHVQGQFSGIRDIVVAPYSGDRSASVDAPDFFSHTKYWHFNATAARTETEETPFVTPEHINVLRSAMNLKNGI
ncbi:hypothetical protein PMI07_006568 [Rhizobium sp. CF080]|uniref:hypothetical protein n=1 Tax=Rhizobium sp. (strain CF080) TaxID=1144310 RepID=UPI0002717053|nr:hypothetical protein [Rhizobium sp. CF080]EUB98254.1 hypothetical protein PMI07_006568 [Rhizobium sp. CF080]